MKNGLMNIEKESWEITYVLISYNKLCLEVIFWTIVAVTMEK